MTGNGSIMHANRGGNHFKKMTAMKKSKKFNQYKADNEAFLAGKAAEEGVLALDNGVVIRKLEQGVAARSTPHRGVSSMSTTPDA